MLEFKLPDVAEGLHEAEILRWMVQPGDQVKLDQPMVEIQTDKSIAEIGAPVSGKVVEIRAQPGSIAHVGEVIILLEPQGGATQGSKTTSFSAASQALRGGPEQAEAAHVAPASNGAQTVKRRAQAAPAARKMAFELGIDIDQVSGSGPGGRVTMEDVRTFAARGAAPAPAPAPANSSYPAPDLKVPTVPAPATPATPATTPTAPGGEERQPLVGLRRRIAERMELAWRTIPHATAFGEADGAALMALREELKPQAEKQGIHLTYIPLLVKIVVQVLKEFPIFNASLETERREIVYKRFYHIGLATNTPDGLLISVVRDADHLTLLDLAREINRLVEAGRSRKLTLPESSGSTFTLNNVGSFGGSGSGVPIINPPEAAILAVGALRERPVARQGTIIARPTLPMTLSFDHRLIDGAGSSAFLARFQELVEHPSLLLLNSY
jgi:pyruvate dehydrogenase E2 component (dihydrolipoamide acetyltransferase)